jgi:STE24 endopeptidase
LLSVFLSVLALIGLGLTQRLFLTVDTWVGTGATGIADPVGLPTLMIIMGAFLLLATPLLSSATRLAESDADAFGLRVAHEPDGMARALVKTIEYRADSPSPLEEALFYDHPSVRRRIQRAMDWKAAHLAVVQDQEALDAAASK